MSNRARSTIDVAAERLREIARAAEPGSLLGNEEGLVGSLGVSRSTIRQVARLLEREGLLRVRRGINGGYFAARPDLNTIETAVSAYLETLDMDAEDVTVVASALWVEALRKAASLRTQEARDMAIRFAERVNKVRPTASSREITKLEQESREQIFALTNARYIELIFQINIAFAQKRFPARSAADDSDEHRAFVEDWRKAKLMELNAIRDGDPELGAMAARHVRNLWHQRVWPAHGDRSPQSK